MGAALDRGVRHHFGSGCRLAARADSMSAGSEATPLTTPGPPFCQCAANDRVGVAARVGYAVKSKITFGPAFDQRRRGPQPEYRTQLAHDDHQHNIGLGRAGRSGRLLVRFGADDASRRISTLAKHPDSPKKRAMPMPAAVSRSMTSFWSARHWVVQSTTALMRSGARWHSAGCGDGVNVSDVVAAQPASRQAATRPSEQVRFIGPPCTCPGFELTPPVGLACSWMMNCTASRAKTCREGSRVGRHRGHCRAITR